MRLPAVDENNTSRELIDSFRGYNHRLRIANNEFWDMRNLSGKDYPNLSNRRKRGLVRTFAAPGGLIEKDALCWVENGTLYVNGVATAINGLSAGEKQLVGMGAYIVIFPDKVYYNTENAADRGSLEATYTNTGAVNYEPCDVDGNVYTIASTGATEPANPTNGQIWADTSGSAPALMQYSSAEAMWVAIPTVYTKITFTSQGTVPGLFKAYDGVTITGTHYPDDLDGEKILYGVGGAAGSALDYLVVVGLLTAALTNQADTITVKRSVPTMNYVCECQNRLWGCYYGVKGTETVNEIYCCALGDFRNWSQYLGLSTDSWTASVGSDGAWTGAVNYLGHPCFFKENRIHVVTVSSQGAHQIEETICRGVQKGSWKSLQVVDETLYYKSPTDVCAWQGGFPTGVSQALGDVKYGTAAAGTLGGDYYISMKDAANAWHLFVLDTKTGLWFREDELHAQYFCRVDDELYCVDADKHLLALRGTTGTLETNISWMAESGIQMYEYPDHKYLSRFNVKVQLGEGATMAIALQYDSGQWVNWGSIKKRGLHTTLIPIRPRRCDHLKVRFTGTGDVQLFSVARILEQGSDYK